MNFCPRPWIIFDHPPMADILIAYWFIYFTRKALPVVIWRTKAKALWFLLHAKRWALFVDDDKDAGQPHCTTNRFRVGSAQSAGRFLIHLAGERLDDMDADNALTSVKEMLK